jgi:hypothetical protein
VSACHVSAVSVFRVQFTTAKGRLVTQQRQEVQGRRREPWKQTAAAIAENSSCRFSRLTKPACKSARL